MSANAAGDRLLPVEVKASARRPALRYPPLRIVPCTGAALGRRIADMLANESLDPVIGVTYCDRATGGADESAREGADRLRCFRSADR